MLIWNYEDQQMKCSQSFTLTHSLSPNFLGSRSERERLWKFNVDTSHNFSQLIISLFGAQPCMPPYPSLQKFTFTAVHFRSKVWSNVVANRSTHRPSTLRQKLLFPSSHFGPVLPLDISHSVVKIFLHFQPLLLRLGRVGWNCEETRRPKESVAAGAKEDYSHFSIFVHYIPSLPLLYWWYILNPHCLS